MSNVGIKGTYNGTTNLSIVKFLENQKNINIPNYKNEIVSIKH